MEMIIPADSHSRERTRPKPTSSPTSWWRPVMIPSRSDGKTGSAWYARRQLAHHWPEPCGKPRSTKGIRRLIWNNLSRGLNRWLLHTATAIHQDMEYLDNTYLPAFPECTHREHQGW